jgi:hypothetical protein
MNANAGPEAPSVPTFAGRFGANAGSLADDAPEYSAVS